MLFECILHKIIKILVLTFREEVIGKDIKQHTETINNI